MCEEYVCAQNGVTKISEIPYGAGYKAVKQEFEKMFQFGWRPQERAVFCKAFVRTCYARASADHFLRTEKG